METVYKVLDDCEIKRVGERKYEFTASTNDTDRDNEVIEQAGWDLKNFKKNPVILYAHNYSDLPIGKATRVNVKDGKLKNTVEFPPEGTYEFADIVERLVGAGYLKTESVGFIPKEWEDGVDKKEPRRTYKKQELLEISIVPVPSNPNALQNAVKAGVITTKQLHAIAPPEELEDVPDDTEPLVEPKALPNEHTCLITNTDKFSEFRQGTRDHEGKEYLVVYGNLKDSSDWSEQSYRYDKDVWEVSEARSDCKGHDGSFEPATPDKASQLEILDEIDYLKEMIKDSGLSGKAKDAVVSLSGIADEVQAEDVEAKSGAVLNKENKNRLNQIIGLAQVILNSAGEEDEEKRLPESDNSVEEKIIEEPSAAEILSAIQELN